MPSNQVLGDLSGRPPCASVAVDAALRGAFIGFVWSGFAALSTLRVEPHAMSFRHFTMGSLECGARFSSMMGLYAGMTCAMERTRGRRDAFNPFVGGVCAGLVLSFPFASFNRSASIVLGTGIFGAILHQVQGGAH